MTSALSINPFSLLDEGGDGQEVLAAPKAATVTEKAAPKPGKSNRGHCCCSFRQLPSFSPPSVPPLQPPPRQPPPGAMLPPLAVVIVAAVAAVGASPPALRARRARTATMLLPRVADGARAGAENAAAAVAVDVVDTKAVPPAASTTGTTALAAGRCRLAQCACCPPAAARMQAPEATEFILQA